jgi:hypothetical protein
MTTEKLTISHALNKNSIPALKDMFKEFGSDQPINPNVGKQELIEDLVDMIPEQEKERIIDETFNTPKTRYTTHLGVFDAKLPSELQLDENCRKYNEENDYDKELKEYQRNKKAKVELVQYTEQELTFYYTNSIKRPEFDTDAMESIPLITSRRIRVVIKPKQNRVSVFTGDRELFNEILTALTMVFETPIKPLISNKTGIPNNTVGSFSLDTVKTLDYIYHGLAKLGTIGLITQIDLETPAKSKSPQKVKVQGEGLLEDKSICEYLFIHARDLVGVKVDLKFVDGEEENKVSVEIGIRDTRVKIGIKKDNYTIDEVKGFLELLEENVQRYLPVFGLINEPGTIAILDKIRNKALSKG